MTATRMLINVLIASLAPVAGANAQEPAGAASGDVPAAIAPADATADAPAPASAPPSTPSVEAPPVAPAPVAAPAPSATGPTATVIFFRPSRLVGAAMGFIVREGQSELGKLRNGKYFVLHVTPGRHDYVVHSEAKDVLTIDAEAGETYYIQGSLGMGLMVGRPNLAPADEATFEAAKGKLKEVAPLSEKD